MTFDILIKGGRIYDGSGLPSYLGDVGVSGGPRRRGRTAERECP